MTSTDNRETASTPKDATVYVALVGDILHAGHINILTHAARLGKVVVGVLTDAAAASYKRLPLVPFEYRKLIFENMRGIERVMAQETLSYRANLLALKPKYVLHGDDWRQGVQAPVRLEVQELLKQWGGELVEIPYTTGVSTTLIHEALKEEGIIALGRKHKLRALLKAKTMLRLLEVHSPVAATIAERVRVANKEFDGFWSSSLGDSIMHGKPDIEVLDHRTRIASLREIFEVTTKPLIYDGDSGHNPDSTYYMAKALDSCGVAGLCLEDKVGRKSNSLYGAASGQQQATIKQFAARINAIRAAVPRSPMMIIARIESLVLGRPLEDALERADAYFEAGADAILIHSVKESPEEVFCFCDAFRLKHSDVPLFAVPTKYAQTYEAELREHGVNCVIYANQLLRASYSAMIRAAQDILREERAAAISEYSVDASELLQLFPEPRWTPR